MAPQAASEKLYHDKFVDIYSDHLCIKSYYFPFGKEKRIEIPFNNHGELSFTTDRDLGFTLLDWKAWGSSVNKVWWALDWTRRPLGSGRNVGIIITVGNETFRKGFSVEDATAALKVLEALLPRTEHRTPRGGGELELSR
ncbi:unnamed protein product [Symbiodinium necroappetens]|uniref:Uncharacterized protein n=1 Tax=Symbiodinium necroappetens TaxID=1628268 RepID=A0A813BRH6_9DINO|nr:unnamed protein product [Symbiodinium necroappetens]